VIHNDGNETKKKISFEEDLKTPKMFKEEAAKSEASTPRRRKHHKSRTESRILLNGQDINLMEQTPKTKEKPLQFNEVSTPDPLSKHPNNPWKTYFDDWEIWNRIKKDIHRTHQTYAFFRSNHMIADDSASKRYRFPFDIAQSPPPMTPSVSMSGAGNVMWNPKIPAHGHKPLFSVGHRRTGTESVGAPILHIPSAGLHAHKGSDSFDSDESSEEFMDESTQYTNYEDRSDHEQEQEAPAEPKPVQEADVDTKETVQDENDKNTETAKHVQNENDAHAQNQTEQQQQEHPHEEVEESPSQPQPEEHAKNEEEKQTANELEKQQSSTTDETQSSPVIRKKSSLLKNVMDEEELELDIESMDEYEDQEMLDGSNNGQGRPRMIGINTNPELPPPAAKNIRFRSSLSQSKSMASRIDPNKKARIERYVLDSQNEGIHSQIMIRILCVYARLNKGIEYVQGMNELLAPIYYIFNMDPSEHSKYAEADSFFCFMNLMSYLGDRFIAESDNSQLGIIAVVNEFDELLEVCDYELWTHLKQQDLDPKFYALRWLMLLMAMEFQLPEVLRLWDSFLSDHNRFEFVTYFAISMLEKVRPQLMSGSFAGNLQLLQKYPSFDLYELLLPAMQFRDKYPMQTVQTKRKKRKKKKQRTLSQQNGRDNSLKNKHNKKKQNLASPANQSKPKSRSPRELFRNGTSSARDLLGNVLRPQSTRLANSKSPPRNRPNPAYNIFRSKSPVTTSTKKQPPGLPQQRSLSFAHWKNKFGATK